MSISPSSATACSTSARHDAGSRTSAAIGVPAPASSTAAASWSTRRAENTTCAPCLVASCATARPMPADAPTTTTRTPLRLLAMVLRGGVRGELGEVGAGRAVVVAALAHRLDRHVVTGRLRTQRLHGALLLRPDRERV